MAGILAALGFTSAAEDEPPPERKSIAMELAETSTHTTSYMENVAKDIVSQPPIFGKARVPVIAGHRDKESLLVEMIDLKKALEETEIHLHMHKQYYLKLLEESRYAPPIRLNLVLISHPKSPLLSTPSSRMVVTTHTNWSLSARKSQVGGSTKSINPY